MELIKISKRAFIAGENLSLTDLENPNIEQRLATKHDFDVNSKTEPELRNFGSVAITFNAKTKIDTVKQNYDSNLSIECNGNARELL